MAAIEKLETGYFRVPLPVPLSDSTHGTITSFELVTTRVRDADGAEGVGYTYTTGHGGGAIAHLLTRDIPGIVAGQDADRIEHLWQKVWWGLHYGGRGFHRSTWRCGTSRRAAQMSLYGSSSAASTPLYPATLEVSISTCPPTNSSKNMTPTSSEASARSK